MVAKDPSFVHAIIKDCNQNGLTYCSLILRLEQKSNYWLCHKQSDKFLSFTTKYEGELPRLAGTYLVCNPITAAYVLPDILPFRLAPAIALLLAESRSLSGMIPTLSMLLPLALYILLVIPTDASPIDGAILGLGTW